jgi:hypothetical protein
VDNFTEEGDFILSDEADADIPESARAVPITLDTLIFKNKSIDQHNTERDSY